MRKMVDEKGEDDHAAHHHVARRESSFDVFLFDIAFGSRAPVIDREPDCHVNVDDDGSQEHGANNPKQRTELTQMLGVTVDPVRPEKDLQIAEQMTDDEQNQNDSRERDDDFFPNGGLVKSGKSGHGANQSAAGWRAGSTETMSRALSVKTAFRFFPVSQPA